MWFFLDYIWNCLPIKTPTMKRKPNPNTVTFFSYLQKATSVSLTVLLFLTIGFSAATRNLQAQSCNQVEILYQSSDCFDKHQGYAGTSGGSSCIEIAVCVNQPYTYSSSVSGTGWTLNWTVTGPTAVVINPNNTSAVVNIVYTPICGHTIFTTADVLLGLITTAVGPVTVQFNVQPVPDTDEEYV